MTTTQHNPSSADPSVAGSLGASNPPSSSLPYGSGDAAYAPALAYAVVAKLMGKELQLSNALKKMQAAEAQDAMNSAAKQAGDTRSAAFIENVGSSVAGAMSIGQGAGSLGVEGYLTGKRSSLRNEISKIDDEIHTCKTKTGASDEPALKGSSEKEISLRNKKRELEAQHEDHHKKKDVFHSAIQGLGQFTQATAKAGTSIQKSSDDARAQLEQADQQSYKQIADEMGSSNQAALSTVNQFTNENFAAATAIRG